MKSKLLKGLKNIHAAKFVGSKYEKPMRIHNAKKIENKFKYESSQEWADDGIIDSSYEFAGGEGTLEVLGLTPDEFVYLFGNTRVQGGVAVAAEDESPTIAILFEKKLRNGGRRLFVIYDCTCAPIDISGTTIEDGKGEYEVSSINYSVGSIEVELAGETKQLIYHFVDTTDETIAQETINAWYEEVQMPKEIVVEEVTKVLKNKVTTEKN
ncbi:MAG: major tail protein [Clostridium sp.]